MDLFEIMILKACQNSSLSYRKKVKRYLKEIFVSKGAPYKQYYYTHSSYKNSFYGDLNKDSYIASKTNLSNEKIRNQSNNRVAMSRERIYGYIGWKFVESK